MLVLAGHQFVLDCKGKVAEILETYLLPEANTEEILAAEVSVTKAWV